jgi:hypothetical protein
VLDEWTGRCSGFATGVHAVVDRMEKGGEYSSADSQNETLRNAKG